MLDCVLDGVPGLLAGVASQRPQGWSWLMGKQRVGVPTYHAPSTSWDEPSSSSHCHLPQTTSKRPWQWDHNVFVEGKESGFNVRLTLARLPQPPLPETFASGAGMLVRRESRCAEQLQVQGWLEGQGWGPVTEEVDTHRPRPA